MSTIIPSVCSTVAALAILSAHTAIAADMAMPSMSAKGTAMSAADQKMINSAMSAAPRKVSAGATIVVMGADGKMRKLREGTNGFTCMPDNPATPDADPMCMDKASWEWAAQMAAHKPPAAGKVGLMYMLAGGSDASNTDPYAPRPTAKKDWIKTGSHVMIVGADASFYDQYPKSAKPDTSVPYVMWAGTPYQHLMIPVK